MNELESQLHYPLGDAMPEPGASAGSGARRALDPDVAAVRAQPHQPVAAARRDRRPAGLDRRRLLHRARRVQGAVGADVRDPARGPADPARDRDPHASGPHRTGRLVVHALERTPVDQRHRLQRGAARAHGPVGLWRRCGGRLLRIPRAERPGLGGADQGAQPLLPQPGAECSARSTAAWPTATC